MSSTRHARPKIAAAGDIHVLGGSEERLRNAFDAVADVDLVLLAGDLTSTGSVEEAAVLAEACREYDRPVCAVLGNHDWHAGEQDAIAGTLRAAGVHLLDRSYEIFELRGRSVGVVGTKGFVGGFLEDRLPDFGEPRLREIYEETTAETKAIEHGLEQVADCDHRIVLLHYAPTTSTLVGEREGVWLLLGADRLAGPIAKHAPDFVLHGHAHAGSAEGAIGRIPVYNVAQSVIGRDFRVIELRETHATVARS